MCELRFLVDSRRAGGLRRDACADTRCANSAAHTLSGFDFMRHCADRSFDGIKVPREECEGNALSRYYDVICRSVYLSRNRIYKTPKGTVEKPKVILARIVFCSSFAVMTAWIMMFFFLSHNDEFVENI